MSSKPAGGKRVARGKAKYDMGANNNSELLNLIVDAALTSGFPKSKSLFMWHMCGHEWKQHIERAVQPRIVAINGLHMEWRRLVSVHTVAKRGRPPASAQSPEQQTAARNEKYAITEAVKALVDAYGVFIGPTAATNLVTWFEKTHRDFQHRTGFSFRLTWTLLAAMTLERCMACAGMGMVCAATLKQKEVLQWPCGQARMCMAARPKCVENQTLCLYSHSPLAWVEQKTRELKTDADKLQWYNGLLARNMLAQKNIFAEGSGESMSAAGLDACFGPTGLNSQRAFGGGSHDCESRLFILYNNYVPKDRTLQGRLGLTNRGFERAKVDTERVVKMKRDEDRARFEARLKKWCTDFDLYIKRISNGRLSWKNLCKTYPNLAKTARRMVELHDPLYSMKIMHRKEEFEPSRGYLYTNGMGIERFRNLVFQVLYAAAYLGPWDAHNVGPANAASAEAQEWACLMYGGVAVGPTGSHRAELDKIKLPRIYPRPDVKAKFGYQRGEILQVPYEEMAAMHIFDKIGMVGVDFTVGVAPLGHKMAIDFFWEVSVPSSHIFLYGHIPRRTRDELVLWHAMFVSAFEKLDSKPDIQLPANVPSKKIFDGVRANHSDAVKEMASYYEEVAVLALFSGTRALLFNFIGMTASSMGKHLRRQFEEWQKGTLTFKKGVSAPLSMHEYYMIVAGAKYTSNPRPYDKDGEAVDDEDDEDDKGDEGDEGPSTFQPYSPTSPAYSPNSPCYEPSYLRDEKQKVDWSQGLCGCLRARPKATVCARHGTRKQQLSMYRTALEVSDADPNMPHDEGMEGMEGMEENEQDDESEDESDLVSESSIDDD